MGTHDSDMEKFPSEVGEAPTEAPVVPSLETCGVGHLLHSCQLVMARTCN